MKKNEMKSSLTKAAKGAVKYYEGFKSAKECDRKVTEAFETAVRHAESARRGAAKAKR